MFFWSPAGVSAAPQSLPSPGVCTIQTSQSTAYNPAPLLSTHLDHAPSPNGKGGWLSLASFFRNQRPLFLWQHLAPSNFPYNQFPLIHLISNGKDLVKGFLKLPPPRCAPVCQWYLPENVKFLTFLSSTSGIKHAAEESSTLSPIAKYWIGLARFVQNPLSKHAALGAHITAISFRDEDQCLCCCSSARLGSALVLLVHMLVDSEISYIYSYMVYQITQPISVEGTDVNEE
ncbi:hypothetical protein BKA83DRAFT_4600590 [Pisolithus microcarpus]|nr:hypothetical protein BKA83DRAFT_4600590 [Pisolithus microcarpus]